MVCILVIFLLLPIWHYGCLVYSEKLISDHKETLHHEFSFYSNSITYSINEKIGLIDGVYSFVVAEIDNNKLDSRFNIFAKTLLSGHSELNFIGVAPDGVYTYIYPESGNEFFLNYNFFNDPSPAIVRQNEYLLNGKPFVLRGPVKNHLGKDEIIITKAVFLNGTSDDGDFWGFVSLSVDLPKIYDQSGMFKIHGYNVAMKNEDYGVFYGNESVFDNSPGLYEMTIGNEIWTFAIAPENGWMGFVEDKMSPFRQTTLFFVIFIGILSGYTVYSHMWLNRAFRKRTDELEKAEDELLLKNLAIDSSVSPVVISDESGRIVYMNKAAQNQWNIDEKTAKMREISSLIQNTEFLSDFFKDKTIEEKEKSNSRTGEVLGLRDDGSSFYGIGSVSEVRDKKGIFHGVHCSFVDITAEKESRSREFEALKQIEKNLLRLAALNDEIRNPLAIIVGYASMSPGEYSEKILDQAGIIDRLINELDQSWMESEKIREYLKKYYEIDTDESEKS